MPIFDQTHPRIIEIAFSFPEFAPACKKTFHSIIFDIQSILESHDQTGISGNAHSKLFD